MTENSKYPKLLIDMLKEDIIGGKRKSINFYPAKPDRDFIMACILFATGSEYQNGTLSEFIIQSIKHYIAVGLMANEREQFKEVINIIDKLKNNQESETVKRLLNELY